MPSAAYRCVKAPIAQTRKATRGILRDLRGSTGSEFALILAPLVLLLFGILEFGRVLYYQNALHYSVQAAARCASIDTTTCSSTTQTQSYAAGISAAGFDSSVFTATAPACGNNVAASYPMTLLIPFVNVSLTLTANYCYPK
jgi:Flp pilus assembly protein TadG